MKDKDLNIALGKLFNGIELDTHKVELNLVGDIKNVSKNISNELKNFDINIKELKDVKRSIDVSIDQAKQTSKRGNSLLKEINKQANELGVPVSEINGVKEFIKLLVDLDASIVAQKKLL